MLDFDSLPRVLDNSLHQALGQGFGVYLKQLSGFEEGLSRVDLCRLLGLPCVRKLQISKVQQPDNDVQDVLDFVMREATPLHA